MVAICHQTWIKSCPRLVPTEKGKRKVEDGRCTLPTKLNRPRIDSDKGAPLARITAVGGKQAEIHTWFTVSATSLQSKSSYCMAFVP